MVDLWVKKQSTNPYKQMFKALQEKSITRSEWESLYSYGIKAYVTKSNVAHTWGIDKLVENSHDMDNICLTYAKLKFSYQLLTLVGIKKWLIKFREKSHILLYRSVNKPGIRNDTSVMLPEVYFLSKPVMRALSDLQPKEIAKIPISFKIGIEGECSE